MLKARYIAAAALALTLGACADSPSHGDGRYYSSPAPTYYPAADAYADYGRVVAIDTAREGGHTTGGGAVIGGIVGGVLGHQIGSGRGNTAATVAGAAGGALAGNEVEKRRGGDEAYRITVQTRDGRESTFTQDSLNGLRVGDRVRIDAGRVYRE
jgi:outer membrane lipoprotein SlyB